MICQEGYFDCWKRGITSMTLSLFWWILFFLNSFFRTMAMNNGLRTYENNPHMMYENE